MEQKILNLLENTTCICRQYVHVVNNENNHTLR